MGLKESGLRGSLRNVSVGIVAIPDSDVYLHDDWGDNQLTSDREDAGETTHNGVTGFYRPEWTIVSGSPTVVDGQLVMETGQISVSANLNDDEPITLELDNLTVLDGGTSFPFWYQDDDNRWQLDVSESNQQVKLVKRVEGSFTDVIEANVDSVSNIDVRLERDDTDNWTLFVNDSEEGSAADNYEPTMSEVRINPFGGNEDDTILDEIKLS